MYATLKKAQPRALQIIENSKRNDRLSHAYLFTGPNGTYKKEMAYHLAMMLYCKEETPCYECENCKAILENSAKRYSLIILNVFARIFAPFLPYYIYVYYITNF